MDQAGFKSMTDKGFTTTVGLAAFPKKNQHHDLFGYQMKAMSACRTAGCEWGFGQLQTLFPFFVQKW
jgi:hypothetical protein